MKKIYNYNPDSFEYLGESIARKDPLEKEERFLIPANATDKEPVFQEGKITKFINNNWILEDIPEPEPEPELTLQQKKDLRIASRKNYLSYQSTGWYIERLSDPSSQKPVPEEILDKRGSARTEINQIEACTTLEQVEVFNIEF
jgi:hypothetical protein